MFKKSRQFYGFHIAFQNIKMDKTSWTYCIYEKPECFIFDSHGSDASSDIQQFFFTMATMMLSRSYSKPKYNILAFFDGSKCSCIINIAPMLCLDYRMYDYRMSRLPEVRMFGLPDDRITGCPD